MRIDRNNEQQNKYFRPSSVQLPFFQPQNDSVMGTIILMAGLGFFALFKNNASSTYKKRYKAALRKGDRVEATEWGKKYYGLRRANRRATAEDLAQIQKDFDAAYRKNKTF